MTKEAIEPGQIWDTLSHSQQVACFALAVTHWGTGVREEYLDYMGVGKEGVRELTERGVIDTRPGWQFFQELADQLRQRAEQIMARMSDPLHQLTEDERTLLNEYERYKSVAGKRNEEPRYRLTSEKLHDFIREQVGKKRVALP